MSVVQASIDEWDQGSLNIPVRSSCSILLLPFRRRRMAKTGLLYSLLPVAVSSKKGVECLVVLVWSLVGNQRGAYLGFFRVFFAKLANIKALLSAIFSNPDSSSNSS